jgi:hypothetical protein
VLFYYKKRAGKSAPFLSVELPLSMQMTVISYVNLALDNDGTQISQMNADALNQTLAI